MRRGKILFFSPEFTFCDLDFNDREKTVEAFRNRVEGFYLERARRLLSASEPKNVNGSFASGLVCICCIDFLALFSLSREKYSDKEKKTKKSRIAKWLEERGIPRFGDKDPDPDLDPDNPCESLADRFCRDFRNGLVHEGYVKNLGEFSVEYDKEIIQLQRVEFVEDRDRRRYHVMIVNPELLLRAVCGAFDDYCTELEKDSNSYRRLVAELERRFDREIAAAKEYYAGGSKLALLDLTDE